MNRRDALKYTAVSLGYALTATTASAILGGCQADTSADWVPNTLTEGQANALSAISDTLLPATESSPGASDVHVHRFIDELYTNWASEETRSKWLADFDALHAELDNTRNNPAFDKLSAEEQFAALNEMNTRALSKDDLSETEQFYRGLKSTIIGAYFSSKEVGMEVLAYDPIPGVYQGCIPYEDVGAAWSL
jgi:hypothetical protein